MKDLMIFTIYEHERLYDIIKKHGNKCNTYSKFNLTSGQLHNAMIEISEIFSDMYDVEVLFKVKER